MKSLLGLLRMMIAVLVMLLGALVIVVTYPLGLRIANAPLAGWIVTGMARLFARLFRVHVSSSDAQALRDHLGFIFPNHLSYLDIIVLLSVTPVRFLSTVEVQRGPVVGLLATSIGTVFVTRSERASRQKARAEIVAAYQAEQRPPIVIFPEGSLGPGDRLLPFHRGAFELAVEHHIDILPCAICYQPVESAQWSGGSGWELVKEVWRRACANRPLAVELQPLAVWSIQGDEEPLQLANEIHRRLAERLGVDREEG